MNKIEMDEHYLLAEDEERVLLRSISRDNVKERTSVQMNGKKVHDVALVVLNHTGGINRMIVNDQEGVASTTVTNRQLRELWREIGKHLYAKGLIDEAEIVI
jgi:hypothetical protein